MTSQVRTPLETAASMALGAAGFAVVSLLGFAVWAAGGKWLHAHFGETGLFAACAVVFLGASGLLMHPLLRGSNRLARFYVVFVPAFFAYAIIWSATWFLFHFGLGEWLASLLGSAAFVLVARWKLEGSSSAWRACAVTFVAHSAGYFLGGKLMAVMSNPILAKLSWGLMYGFGFGAGIGYTFFIFQKPADANSRRHVEN